MSEPVMALGGARSAGFAAVSELPVRGMIALRAELGAPAVAEALAALGLPMPARRRIEERGARAVAWMSPDELLLMMPQEAVPGVLQTLEQRLGEAHHLAADVSDMRALFRIEGAGAREVLAKLCPVDLAPASFGTGEFRRTRLAQVAAAFWLGEDGAFTLVCFRSVARYAFDALSGAAAAGGEVGYFPA